jgi:DNA-binding transcriptional regulator YhcF (GntR family)
MMIERFWEQSLLQRAIDQKNREIANSVSVSDKTIEEAYKKLQGEGKADKPYDQMYNQIKWSLNHSEESKAMQRWIMQLYKDASIKVNSAYAITNNIKDITDANYEN